MGPGMCDNSGEQLRSGSWSSFFSFARLLSAEQPPAQHSTLRLCPTARLKLPLGPCCLQPPQLRPSTTSHDIFSTLGTGTAAAAAASRGGGSTPVLIRRVPQSFTTISTASQDPRIPVSSSAQWEYSTYRHPGSQPPFRGMPVVSGAPGFSISGAAGSTIVSVPAGPPPPDNRAALKAVMDGLQIAGTHDEMDAAEVRQPPGPGT